MLRRPRQTELRFRSHGGRREGAGRPKGNRVPHVARPQFDKPLPVHVTLRMGNQVWNLRSGRSFRRIKACLNAAKARLGCRVIEFSVQGNHIHLVLEADGSDRLTRAVQGLSVRIAKALNAMMGRSGRVFGDHYHSRLLRTPTELVNAIAYVLGNAGHHFGGRPDDDPYSSAQVRDVLADPVGWLLRVGWRRAARIPAWLVALRT